jgi:murein hydrolase activator
MISRHPFDFLIRTFVLFLLVSLWPPPPSRPASDQERMREIEARLFKEKESLAAFHARERDILAQLSNLEEEVAKKKVSMEEIKKKLVLSRRARDEISGDLSQCEREIRDTEEQLACRLVALYKSGRKGYVKFLATAENLDQFRGRMKYSRAVMEEDRKTLGKLLDNQAAIGQRAALLKEKVAQVEQREAAEKNRMAQLDKELEEKVFQLMNVHKEKQFYETAVEELKLAAEELKRALIKSEVTVSDSTKRVEFSRFRDSKGKLPPPIEGRFVNSSQFQGYSETSSGRGIFIESPSEREVKAVFGGRVDFSGKLKGYGDLIVINHGTRFYSISAFLSQRLKQEGDVVESGDVIGHIGIGDGALKGRRLYFELRKGGDSLDPLEWFGKK